MSEELKPCPFCGRHELLISSILHKLDDVEYSQWSVFCDASGCKVGCGAMCGYHDTKEQAIEAWNRRVGEQE